MTAREDLSRSPAEIPVLIIGGGLVGLSTAMFLAQHGIASVVAERLRGVSALPRAAHFHLRTLELFRSAGVEDAVRRQSELEFTPEGAIVALESLAGKQIAAYIPSLNESVEALSPSRRLFITQPGLEPILRARAEQAGAKVMDGTELVALAQDRDGVTATVRDVDSGLERRLRAKYVVGADGPHSKTRELLTIPFDGRGVFSNSITIYFHADVAKLMSGRNFSVMYIINPALSGFVRLDKDSQAGFLVVNTVGDTSLPETANAAADTGVKRLLELVRAAIGASDIAVKIDGINAALARGIRRGTPYAVIGGVFIAGDAAHVMPPNGGFGGNTGIHDAHNLAWKLAFVLNGHAGADLLASYNLERQPIGKFTVEQAYTRYVTRTAPYLGATDYEPQANDFNIELGYLYQLTRGYFRRFIRRLARTSGCFGGSSWLACPASVDREGRTSAVDARFVQHGLRALSGARRRSPWLDAAHTSRSFRGLPFVAYRFGDDLADPSRRFGALYGLNDTGAALIRPDGFVGWRAPTLSPDPESALREALASLLAKV